MGFVHTVAPGGTLLARAAEVVRAGPACTALEPGEEGLARAGAATKPSVVAQATVSTNKRLSPPRIMVKS